MIILSALVGVVAVVLLLPTASDLVSAVVAIGPRRIERRSGVLPRLLFLVPAHDEELLLPATLRSLHELR